MRMTSTLPADLTCPPVAPRAGSLTLSRIVARLSPIGDWAMSVEQRIAFIEQCLALAKERRRTKRQAELERQLHGLRLAQMQLEDKAGKASRRAA